jgi:hypothetical protein
MSQPLAADDPPPHRPTRVQASLRRRAYRRGRDPEPSGPPPLDELDELPEPDAEQLTAEEQLEAIEAREEAEGLFEPLDDAERALDDEDTLDLADLEEVHDVEQSDEIDVDDVEPGGPHPEAYDELDLADVAAEPDVETLDELDVLEVDVEQLDDEELAEIEDALLEDDELDLEDEVEDAERDAAAEPAVVAPAPQGRRAGRRRYVPARRVRRTIRRVDPLSLAKLALVFNLCFLVMTLVAGVIIWTVASASGSIDNIESFVEDIGFEDFRLQGGQLLQGFAIGGLVLALAGTFFAFIMGVLFNLLSDLVGGIRITMVEPDER